jgi:Asp-tRNA(Asn)/Glu-tRNA(Gln) amidotransferase A subunit family amidase
MIIKDNYDVTGFPTTAGSPSLKDSTKSVSGAGPKDLV